jgi:hypothetical protein
MQGVFGHLFAPGAAMRRHRMTRMNVPLACAVLAALAAIAPTAGAVGADEPPPGGPPEPNVRLTVVEDDRARIEELRVRGRTQRITVTPKGPIGQPYEILPADGVREVSPNAQGDRGTAGQRVWNVFSF